MAQADSANTTPKQLRDLISDAEDDMRREGLGRAFRRVLRQEGRSLGRHGESRRAAYRIRTVRVGRAPVSGVSAFGTDWVIE